MGKPQSTGNLVNAIAQDSSNNIGIGGAANASFKLQVTGTTNVTGVLTLGSTISNGTYTYTLPSATGTLALTSNLSAYLPLTGGTLTGALSGTSATFSTDLVVNGWLRPNSIYAFTADAGTTYIQQPSGGNIVLRKSDSTAFLTIANTGAATFSSSIDVATTARFHSSSNWMQFQQNVLTSQNNDGAHIRSVVSADSAPTYSWAGDQDTGMYTPAANTIAFSTGATERMRITSGGNVGIGSSDAGALLVLRSTQANSSNYPWLTFRNGANGYGTWGFFKSGSNNLSLGYSTDTDTPMNNATAITFQYGGNVGIATLTPSALLHLEVANASVDGTKGVKITNPAGTSVMLECGVSSDSFVGTTSVSDFSIRTGNTERMRITTGGQLYFSRNSGGTDIINIEAYTGFTGRGILLNMDAGSDAITIGGAGSQNAINVTSSSKKVIISNLGGSGTVTVQADNSGTLIKSSDSSLKQEDKEYKIQGLAEILQLQPRAYKWLKDIEIRKEEAVTEIGFFADEVNPIIPSAAPKGFDGLYGFNDRAVTAALVKSIQELEARIKQLENK